MVLPDLMWLHLGMIRGMGDRAKHARAGCDFVSLELNNCQM